jgi:hypothetical protein
VDFIKVSSTLLKEFGEEKIRYAVIGGFALGFWGVTRATVDMDFLLLLEDADRADKILRKHRYTEVFRTENVSRYQSEISDLGTIDIIYSFREISKSMLARSVEVSFADDLSIVTLIPEDIIGLKIQAIANDEDRSARDKSDINALLDARNKSGEQIDWPLLNEYCDLFDFNDLYEELRTTHDQAK